MSGPHTAPEVRRLLVLSVAAFAAFLIVYVVAVQTELGQRADEAALAGGQLAPAEAISTADQLLRVVSVGSLLLAIAALSGFAWLRREPGLVIIPIAVIGGSLVGTELFKHVLLPRPGLVPETLVLGNSYPSGHTTVAISIGLAALLIAPIRLRRVVGLLAAGLAAAGGVFVVAADWHRPSDPIGSFLLTLAVAAAVMACVRIRWGPGSEGDPRAPSVPGQPQSTKLALTAMLGGMTLFVLVSVITSLRYGSEIDWNRFHLAYLLSAAAIVVTAGLTVAAMMRALEGPASRQRPEPIPDSVLAKQPNRTRSGLGTQRTLQRQKET